MKNLFIKGMAVMGLIAITAITNMACENDNSKWDEEATVSYAQLERELMDSIYISRTLDYLCEVTYNEDGTIRYIPDYGEAIDEKSPQDFYVIAESYEDAKERFLEFMLQFRNEENITEKADGTIVYSVKNWGTMTLKPGNNADIYASIDVDFEVLPDMKHIYFIPKSLWPDNQVSTPFTINSILKHRINGKYYICIREYMSDSEGILISFNGTKDEWHIGSYKGNKGCRRKMYQSWIYTNINTNYEALKTFSGYLNDFSDEDRKELQRKLNTIKAPFTLDNIGDAPFLYLSTGEGKYFHWGLSDRHYIMKIGTMTIKWHKSPVNNYDEYKTCQKGRDLSKENIRYSIAYFFKANTEDNKYFDVVE